MKNLEDYTDRGFSPDRKLCESEAYRAASDHFSVIISLLEHKYPEDKELIWELIVVRAVLETSVINICSGKL